MRTSTRILGIIVLILGFLAITHGMRGQNVVLKNKTFVQQTTAGDSINTGYYYQDLEGIKYPIFLSSKGKAYCWLKSKKTGKMYKRYLPKITQELNNKQK